MRRWRRIFERTAEKTAPHFEDRGFGSDEGTEEGGRTDNWTVEEDSEEGEEASSS